MKKLTALIALALVAWGCMSAAALQAAVRVVDLDWRDEARSRDVPVRVYVPDLPADAPPAAMIVFSHGLGGSREGYAYLGQSWAQHGYVSVHVQHPGSDDAVWRDQPRDRRMKAMRQAATDLHNAADRPRDVSFAIDQMLALNAKADSPLLAQSGAIVRIDPNRIGVGGHSFGAYTTLAVIGLRPGGRLGGGQSSGGGLAEKWSFTDPRIKAAVVMSAPVSPVQARNAAWAFGAIAVPALHLTGEHDNSQIGDTEARDRRVPFDHITKAPQYLAVFRGEGGDHMVFSGNRWRGKTMASDDAYHADILKLTTAFFDAYLRHDAQALQWLNEGAAAKDLAKDAAFETRNLDGGQAR
jgi:predicted dienelactone hydrolase